jgi:hypothetical protein
MQKVANSLGFKLQARTRDEMFDYLKALVCELSRRDSLRLMGDGDVVACQNAQPFPENVPLYSNSRVTQNSLMSRRLIPSELRRAELLAFAKAAHIQIPPDELAMQSNANLLEYLINALTRRMNTLADMFAPDEGNFVRERIIADARNFRTTKVVY